MRIPPSFKLELLLNGTIKDRKLGLKIIQRCLSISGKDSIEAVFNLRINRSPYSI